MFEKKLPRLKKYYELSYHNKYFMKHETTKIISNFIYLFK